MNRFGMAVAAVASLALAAPAAAQSNAGGGAGAANSPRLGKPAAQTTGASAKAINRASGGGVRHGPRTASGKVTKAAKGKSTATKPAKR